jgi:hypothetical protein
MGLELARRLRQSLSRLFNQPMTSVSLSLLQQPRHELLIRQVGGHLAHTGRALP